MTDARTIPYVVLSAAADGLRGEQLNYGLLALPPSGPVVKLHDGAVRRLKTLHPDYAHWSADTEQSAMQAAVNNSTDPLALLAMTHGVSIDNISGTIHLHDTENGSEFDDALNSILQRMVAPPRKSMASPKRNSIRQSKLAMQMKSWFRLGKVFSNNAEDLSKGRVVSNFPVAARDDLFADFAVKGGRLHVIETLDLRGVDHLTAALRGDAAVKGITLDEAKAAVDGQRIAVVTATNFSIARPAIKMLERYASDLYVLESPKDKQSFVSFMHSVLHSDSLPELDLKPTAKRSPT